MANKSVVIYSGGMDSFTLLNELMRRGDEVSALSFNYGQRHWKELEYAEAFALKNNLPHKIIDMADIGAQLLQGSSQTSAEIDVPEGHYEEESMKLTVVPNRNMIMLSLAIGYAVSIEAASVYFGAHSGDHAIYPDCRVPFVEAMNNVARIANFIPVAVFAPYLGFSKGQIALRGKEMELDYGQSWTCYNGRDKACGKCGACQERLEAMAYAGLIDPLEYE